MPTLQENLQTALENYSAALAAGDVKPSYSIGGRSVDWPSYHKWLLEQIRSTQELLNAVDPFEIPVRTD